MREKEHFHMYAMTEEEHVRMAQNNIIILSESSSSDDSLETSSDESSGSVKRQIPTKPVMSSNKSSTFRPHCHQITRRKHLRMTNMIYVQGKNQQST